MTAKRAADVTAGDVLVIARQEWTVTGSEPGRQPRTVRVTLRSADCGHCQRAEHEHVQFYSAGERVTVSERSGA